MKSLHSERAARDSDHWFSLSSFMSVQEGPLGVVGLVLKIGLTSVRVGSSLFSVLAQSALTVEVECI